MVLMHIFTHYLRLSLSWMDFVVEAPYHVHNYRGLYHYMYILVLEWTVLCSRTVRFFVMFDMFKVWFRAKMWCSEVFEVWSCCYVIRLVLELKFNVRELFGFLWCLPCSKFDFGPKCDVRKVRCLDIQCLECLKFGILVFVSRLVYTLYISALLNICTY